MARVEGIFESMAMCSYPRRAMFLSWNSAAVNSNSPNRNGLYPLAADQQDLFKNRFFKKFLKNDTSLYKNRFFKKFLKNDTSLYIGKCHFLETF